MNSYFFEHGNVVYLIHAASAELAEALFELLISEV